LKTINVKEQADYTKQEWTRIVNCLSGFKSVNLVGTVDSEGVENLSVISSFFHLGASPALMGFVVRPHSTKSPRHTLMNIKETNFYTMNAIVKDIYLKAHQASARYPFEVSEFDQVNLPSVYKNAFKAPYVENSSLQVGFKLVEIVDVKHNQTQIIIGEVVEIHILEKMLRKDGFVDIEAGGVLALSGLDSYHETKRLARLSYAKPDKEVAQLSVDGEPL